MIDYNIKIKSFEIKNFRLFEKQKVLFDENHSYISLLGKNASGKTAFLEAINICLSENSSKFNSIREDDFFSEEPIEFAVEFNRPFFLSFQDGNFSRLLPCTKYSKIIKRRKQKVKGDFFSPQYTIDTKYDLSTYERLRPKEYQKKTSKYAGLLPPKSLIVWSLSKVEESGYSFTIESSDEIRMIKTHELFSLDKVLFPKVFYFDKNRSRELLAQYNTAFASIVKELDWKYRKKFVGEDKESLLNKFDEIHKEIESFVDYKKELFLPAIEILKNELDVDFDVDTLSLFHFDINQPFQSAIFGHKTLNNNIIDVNKSGSGIASLVALSFLVAFSRESKNSIIVLIDEPELHLHADLQKNLFIFLNNSNYPVIVSTHSHLFADKKNFCNNLSFDFDSQGKIRIEPCDQISLGNALFGLLGNSLEDLYIPEYLLLVDGKYDKKILSKCLTLLGDEKNTILILDCGGEEGIPQKSDKIEAFFNMYFGKEKWFSRFIQEKFRMIVDGDVSADRISQWKKKYNLMDESVMHLEKKCLEYLYPESLIKQLVQGKKLKNDEELEDKTKDNIITIILGDEKLRGHSDKHEKVQQKTKEIISKQRLTEFVSDNLTQEILNQSEGRELMELTKWITGRNS